MIPNQTSWSIFAVIFYFAISGVSLASYCENSNPFVEVHDYSSPFAWENEEAEKNGETLCLYFARFEYKHYFQSAKQLIEFKTNFDELLHKIKSNIARSKGISADFYRSSTKEKIALIKSLDFSFKLMEAGFLDVDSSKVTRKSEVIPEPKLKRIIFTLANFLTLHDAAMYALAKLSMHSETENFYNNLRNESRLKLKKHLKLLTSNRKLNYFFRMIKVYKRHYLTSPFLTQYDNELTSAHNVIQASPTYFEYSQLSRWKRFKKRAANVKHKIGLGSRSLGSFLNHVRKNIFYVGSMLFGKTFANFKSRNGRLNNNDEFINDVSSVIEPLDILIEKTPFRLTDRFIPGYWGHAAVFIGFEDQLKKLGIWNEALVQKYSSQIKNGHGIAEALRSGVSLGSLETFSNIDDFAIIRLKEKPDHNLSKKYILNALTQIGKKYDYGFSIENGNKILCTEMIYTTFTDIFFNTSQGIKGKFSTIDQIAEKALENGEFETVLLYLNGRKVDSKDINTKYEALIK